MVASDSRASRTYAYYYHGYVPMALCIAPQSSSCATRVARSACLPHTRVSWAAVGGHSRFAADEAQARCACDRLRRWGTMRWKARACRLPLLGALAGGVLHCAHANCVMHRLWLRVLGRRARGRRRGHRKPVLQRQRRAPNAQSAAPSARQHRCSTSPRVWCSRCF